MAPKRKVGRPAKSPASKKAKNVKTPVKASAPPDLTGKESYCSEVGIDMANGGSQAVFQWLCCSIIFGNRISEKTTIRAATGLIKTGFTTPESLKDASMEEKIKALNSEGNVQRGPSMSDRLGETAKLVLEKYEGDLEKLREAAKKKPAALKKLVKEFKGIGDTGVNIFFREAQLQWDELFPYADASSLKLARDHGYPGKSAKELAEFVGNDKTKFVALLAAMTKDELRGTNIIEEATDGDAAQDSKANGAEQNAEDEQKDAPEEKTDDVEMADAATEEKKESDAPTEEKTETENKTDEKVEEKKAEEEKGTEAEGKKSDEKTNGEAAKSENKTNGDASKTEDKTNGEAAKTEGGANEKDNNEKADNAKKEDEKKEDIKS